VPRRLQHIAGQHVRLRCIPLVSIHGEEFGRQVEAITTHPNHFTATEPLIQEHTEEQEIVPPDGGGILSDLCFHSLHMGRGKPQAQSHEHGVSSLQELSTSQGDPGRWKREDHSPTSALESHR